MLTGVSVDHYSVDHNGVHVSLSDGRVLQGDYLVGADGIHSKVRVHV
jgi:2-polyprenyl-6-methoxyphenol hydroxylase-like FAD-dependent oxidoreductase